MLVAAGHSCSCEIWWQALNQHGDIALPLLIQPCVAPAPHLHAPVSHRPASGEWHPVLDKVTLCLNRASAARARGAACASGAISALLPCDQHLLCADVQLHRHAGVHGGELSEA